MKFSKHTVQAINLLNIFVAVYCIKLSVFFPLSLSPLERLNA